MNISVFAGRLDLFHLKYLGWILNIPWEYAIAAQLAALLGFSLLYKDCGLFQVSRLDILLPLQGYNMAYLTLPSPTTKISIARIPDKMFLCQQNIWGNIGKYKIYIKILIISAPVIC